MGVRITFKSPCSVSVRHTARKHQTYGKWLEGVSSCCNLLAPNVCDSSFLISFRCHGWIWAQNRSAFSHICSGCQRSHCQTGVLCSREVSKQGHIAQIQVVVCYSGTILITGNTKLQSIAALLQRYPLDNTPCVFLCSFKLHYSITWIGTRRILSSGSMLSECREVQHRSSAVRWHVSAWGGRLNGEFSPRDPCVLIIESPNVSVFPGCFRGLLWMWKAKVMCLKKKNEIGNSCLPGGKTLCVRRDKIQTTYNLC